MILDELLINSASEGSFWIAWLRASPTISNWRSTRIEVTDLFDNRQVSYRW